MIKRTGLGKYAVLLGAVTMALSASGSPSAAAINHVVVDQHASVDVTSHRVDVDATNLIVPGDGFDGFFGGFGLLGRHADRNFFNGGLGVEAGGFSAASDNGMFTAKGAFVSLGGGAVAGAAESAQGPGGAQDSAAAIGLDRGVRAGAVSATTAGGSSEFKAAAVSLEPTTTTRNGNTTIGVDNEGGVLLQTAHATATDNGVSTRGRQIIATDDQVEISSASSSASPDRLHVTGSRLLVS